MILTTSCHPLITSTASWRIRTGFPPAHRYLACRAQQALLRPHRRGPQESHGTYATDAPLLGRTRGRTTRRFPVRKRRQQKALCLSTPAIPIIGNVPWRRPILRMRKSMSIGTRRTKSPRDPGEKEQERGDGLQRLKVLPRKEATIRAQWTECAFVCAQALDDL